MFNFYFGFTYIKNPFCSNDLKILKLFIIVCQDPSAPSSLPESIIRPSVLVVKHDIDVSETHNQNFNESEQTNATIGIRNLPIDSTCGTVPLLGIDELGELP